MHYSVLEIGIELISIYRIVIIIIGVEVESIPNNTHKTIANIPSQFSSEKHVYSVISAGANSYKFLLFDAYGTVLSAYNYSGQIIKYLYGQICYIK